MVYIELKNLCIYTFGKRLRTEKVYMKAKTKPMYTFFE